MATSICYPDLREERVMTPATSSWELLGNMLPRFAARAAEADERDAFVGENFVELKAAGLMGAGVPDELGGGGSSVSELADMLRAIAHSCSSTALAFSMHTHQVATNAWRWKHAGAPVDGLLRRVAAENLHLLSSGGSDWLQGSGTATKVDGGFLINGRKVFSSGAPSGDLLMTSAVYLDPQAGTQVLHFGVPMKAAGVKLIDTWRTLGMRGTGSFDIELKDVFIAEAAIGGRRPQGKWHPLFHTIAMVAFPLIYAAYVGVAEAAREKVVKLVSARPSHHDTVRLIGRIDTELALARLALDDMIATAENAQPGPATTNRSMTNRALAARGVLAVVELAMEAVGGAGFYRSTGLERLFRDAQAARYHPLRDAAQQLYAGRSALGLDIDDAA
jgi:acyl-CoA dehydrogenase